VVSLLKINRAQSTLYLGVYMNFCHCFPHSLFDSGEIQCKRTECGVVEHM